MTELKKCSGAFWPALDRPAKAHHPPWPWPVAWVYPRRPGGGDLGRHRRPEHGLATFTRPPCCPNGRVLAAGATGPPPPAWPAPSSTTRRRGPGRGPAPWATARYHTATLLPNGQVLVAGGIARTTSCPAPSSTTRRREPGRFTGSLTTARRDHTATLLPNGRVLVAGGWNGAYLTTAELYNPATGTWTATGTLLTARRITPPPSLPNGLVLVAGGMEQADSDQRRALQSGDGHLDRHRPPRRSLLHTATLLPNGRVLVAGGQGPAPPSWTAPSSTIRPRALGPPPAPWSRPGNTTLPPSCATARSWWRGVRGPAPPSCTAELYDPTTGAWTATGPLVTAREHHTATLLRNGQVLGVGAGTAPALGQAEL